MTSSEEASNPSRRSERCPCSWQEGRLLTLLACGAANCLVNDLLFFWRERGRPKACFLQPPKGEQRRCLLNLNTKKSEREEENDYTRGGIFIPKCHTGSLSKFSSQGWLSQPLAHHSQATPSLCSPAKCFIQSIVHV